MSQPYIFIDGSYFIFHRYYALHRWWTHAKPNEPLGDNPFMNVNFVDKFRKTFVSKLKELPKLLKLNKLPSDQKPIMIVSRDCKREDIWRNALYPAYKATRANGPEDGFMGGSFFKMAYEDNLFQEGGCVKVLYHPKLEADDCVALYVRHLRERANKITTPIYILTSDCDYLQLCDNEHTHIYTLNMKPLNASRNATGDAKKDLQMKIIMGDKSDNIVSVFAKCGPKTALKCLEDESTFHAKITNVPECLERYKLNERLVSFTLVPKELADEFYAECMI